ncbi:MAG: metallophosphoesterase [Kiritimatiellae bacterium]|nr:metallophosphoesterase [Kiritimatiellia bacterium]
MNMTTRQALTRRTFFGQATAATVLAAAGCLPRKGGGGEPKLKVGVLSDVHLLVQKDSMKSDVWFEKALRWYDERKADAVLLCGDIADCGLVSELEYAAEIWYRVFPGDRRSDGEPIARLFHFGDHDYGGYAHKYPWAVKCSKDPDAPNHALVNEDVVAIWDRLFHEKWEPIQVKNVKGYTFVLAHHPHNMGSGTVIPGLAEALAAANPDPTKPFFYSMHRPVHGTLPEWDPKSLENDPNHKALAKYPNVMAFFGHCHRNCADELSLWQGEYTVVHVPSTSYCCTRGGRENSFSCGNQADKKRPQLMNRVDCMTSNQALFVTVCDDSIVLERRDVRHDAAMGPNWVIPLPSPDGSCSELVRRSVSVAPAFPEGATATVSERVGKNRAKQQLEQVVVTFPPAHSGDGRPRALDYEVVASAKDFKLVRRVFSTRAYWTETEEKEPSCCVFGKFELPKDKAVTFTVRPANSFGICGDPLPPVKWSWSS